MNKKEKDLINSQIRWHDNAISTAEKMLLKAQSANNEKDITFWYEKSLRHKGAVSALEALSCFLGLDAFSRKSPE